MTFPYEICVPAARTACCEARGSAAKVAADIDGVAVEVVVAGVVAVAAVVVVVFGLKIKCNGSSAFCPPELCSPDRITVPIAPVATFVAIAEADGMDERILLSIVTGFIL
jgi:hypothetical protein